MICLREKGVLLRDSYYLEAEYTENLSEEQRQFLAMVQEYKECHPVFSAEKIGAIFEAARRLGIPRKGNLSQKECYYIKEIEQSLVCEKEEYFLKRKLKGVPESIQEQIQGVVGNPCLIRKDGTKHYLFFAPEIAALWNKGHDIPLKLTDIPAMCESLVHKQYYDRELFAESIWKFARPLYVIKAGIEEEKNRFLPKFFFVPLTKAHQDKLSVSCEKYQEILEKYMGSVLNFETGICLTNFQEAFQFIGEVRKNRSLDKRDLSEEATKNLRHFFSVLQNQGWHCELKIMRSLEKRISFVLKHKHEEDTLLILTDPQRVSVWGKFFPEALIYTQENLAKEFEQSHKGKNFSLVWDCAEVLMEKTCFFRFLMRYLPIKEEILFIRADKAMDGDKYLNLLGELLLRSDLTHIVQKNIQKTVSETLNAHRIMEFYFPDTVPALKKLINILLKNSRRSVVLFVETDSRREKMYSFLTRYFRGEWAEAKFFSDKSEKPQIYIARYNDFGKMDVNHCILFREEISDKQKEYLVCESQSRNQECLLCIYQFG